jgi:hypothetical protein
MNSRKVEVFSMAKYLERLLQGQPDHLQNLLFLAVLIGFLEEDSNSFEDDCAYNLTAETSFCHHGMVPVHPHLTTPGLKTK